MTGSGAVTTALRAYVAWGLLVAVWLAVVQVRGLDVLGTLNPDRWFEGQHTGTGGRSYRSAWFHK